MANLLLNFALIVGSIAGIFVAPRFIPEKYKKFSKAAQAGFALLAFMGCGLNVVYLYRGQ